MKTENDVKHVPTRMEAVFLSYMCPQLRNEYQKIIDEYKEEGWGIYDDTADLDRAVILRDAYHGNDSSVMQLYQQTGKPIMLQNVCILN